MRWKERTGAKQWSWHRWFAWRPIKTMRDDNGSRTWVWLEIAWRQGYLARVAPYKSRWIWDYTVDKPDGVM